MRFEIGPGGAFVILIGLAALSGGTFALGLLAGYEMSHPADVEHQEQAATYPLPSPPSAEASPTPASNAGTGPALSGGSAASPRLTPSAPVASVPPVRGMPSSAASPGFGPAEGGEENEPITPPAAGASPLAGSKPETAAGSKRGPYSVQIEAVMDKDAAQALSDKLKRKGFEPYVVQTEVNGQTWYRVRVGHYASEDAADEAQ